ncbi:MAG TPA: ABC transporter ATP-binding protein [Devosia sp.]|jgi:peptide/nickel transport system ATP-binding protein|uniref:ABC transporter ATP-binding protein n=1 Tax=Devosia sp. TaxID=1871048 RepID=UPI002DDCF5FD|nr:ABC transporter ATP-binding protein [Devosia sp.]HEV2517170.1 ABC transporter ATP-binding protein [Devosia sp.]
MLDLPALDIVNLSVGYAGENGIISAVDGVSLGIAHGEFMGLAGESGCGKSTIAQSILRLLRAPGIITGGEIRIAGNDMLSSDEGAVRALRWRTASIVLQNSLTSLNPVKRIDWQLREVINRGGASIRRTPAELLQMVDIDPRRLSAFPHELSGGQRQRVVIAMALALEPKLIILDEPTTALDVIVQQEIFVTVKALQRKMGFAVLLITHDLPLLFEVADRIAVMKDGKIVETAPVAEFQRYQSHPYSRTLLTATPKVDFSVPAVARPKSVAHPVLETAHLTKAYGTNPLTGRSALVAVNDVSFRLAPREIVALVGASGSGKSTFGRIVTGLTRASSGDVLVDGRTPVPVSRRRRNQPRAAQMVFQDVYGSLNPLHTIGHHLRRAVISAPGGYRSDVEGRVAALLREVGLTPAASYLDRRPHELSGGQRQRVGLARALAASPKLLVADEPVSMLDVSIRRDILNLIARLRDEQGVAVLYITHDVVSAGYIADRIAVMHRGQIVEEGLAKAVLANPQHEYTRELIAAVPGGLGLDPAHRARQAPIS